MGPRRDWVKRLPRCRELGRSAGDDWQNGGAPAARGEESRCNPVPQIAACRDEERTARVIDKTCADPVAAIQPIGDGASVMVGGFGTSGIPYGLLNALAEKGARDLTIISNNAGEGEAGIAALLKLGLVAKVICSYPRTPGSVWFERRYKAGEVALEVMPQGTLAERMRAAGSGLGGFFTPTGYGTKLAEGKETRVIGGRGYVFEPPLSADFALIRGETGDRWGNLSYHATARNFNPVMAMAARHSIAEVRQVSTEPLHPERVVTPGIFIASLCEYAVRP